MSVNVRRKPGNRGAALLLALGMLTVLSVLGAACLLSLQTDTEEAALRLMKIRAAHAAEAGVQYALGGIVRATGPAAVSGGRRYEVGVYGPVRKTPRTVETTARLANFKAYAQVSVEQVAPNNCPADAAGTSVVATIGADEGRLYRIVSDGVVCRTAGGRDYGRTAVRTAALVLLRPAGPEFVYWNSGPAPQDAAKDK